MSSARLTILVRVEGEVVVEVLSTVEMEENVDEGEGRSIGYVLADAWAKLMYDPEVTVLLARDLAREDSLDFLADFSLAVSSFAGCGEGTSDFLLDLEP